VALVSAFGLVLLISVSGVAARTVLSTVTIALSIVSHSSTDVPVATALRVEPPDSLPTGTRHDDDRKPA
jgi:hypothetical protein